MRNKIQEIEIPTDNVQINGILTIPEGAKALVIFSHGAGSSRFSPRNTFVADALNKRRMATLLIDLLTEAEYSIYHNRFNIELLTERLIAATHYIQKHETCKHLTMGYFGSSTGAASAINAAVKTEKLIGAIVSRGGRPDLATVDFSLIKAPTLLIVGSLDGVVIDLNEAILDELTIEKKMSIVQGATHLFEEEGKLNEVAKIAGDWFQKFLIEKKSYSLKQLQYDF